VESEKLWWLFAAAKSFLSFSACGNYHSAKQAALMVFRRKMEAQAEKSESAFAKGKYIIILAKQDYHSSEARLTTLSPSHT